MRAEQKDIEFADKIAAIIRASIRVPPDNDAYWMRMNVECDQTAKLYEASAAHMRSTGEWQMPTDAELRAIEARVWDFS